MTEQELKKLAEDCGFDHCGMMNMEALVFDPQVREMCAADRCQNYGRSWSCPPGCGTLEEIAQRVAGYARGILLQSTGLLEDDFDLDTMMETEARHRERFFSYVEKLRGLGLDILPMASGACSACSTCTYPHAPCRDPRRAIPSMEAYGLMVSRVCLESGLGYYYGPGTITYTACVLLRK